MFRHSMKLKPLRSCGFVVAAALLAIMPARAQSLLDLFASARSYDASYRSAQLQLEAALARAE